MSEYQEHEFDQELERYLDGQLEGEELQLFEARIENEPELRAAVYEDLQLQNLVGSRLSPPEPTIAEIESLLAESSISRRRDGAATGPRSTDRKSWIHRRGLLVVIVSALAAVIAWGIVAMRPASREVQPFFAQRPVAELYGEVVKQGFRPYYYCEDQDRFARTFRKRQRTPLNLAATPNDRRMVGLSYIGGLSRDTTAMLAYVEDQEVVVFVDRLEFDNEPLMSQLSESFATDLYVHRTELQDLVCYEVSPFASTKMTPFLKLGK